jgi:hypothetical protein
MAGVVCCSYAVLNLTAPDGRDVKQKQKQAKTKKNVKGRKEGQNW